MRNIYFFILLFIGGNINGAFGQIINLNSQTEVDNFSSSDTLAASLNIETTVVSDPITNLSNLSNITRIVGGLSIQNNPTLKSIDELSNLTSIGGIRVMNNDSLLMIKFPILNDLNVIIITGNNALISIEGFYELDDYGDSNFTISNSPNLELIIGLNNITSVGENFTIANCPKLCQIDAFANLTSVGEGFTLSGIKNIGNPNAFANLTSVSEEFELLNISELTNLDAFANLISVNDEVYIQNNSSLVDCCAIQEFLASSNYEEAVIANNPSECSSVEEVLADACGTVSTSEINLSKVYVFPNPSRDVLWVENVDLEALFSIVSIDGKVMQTGVLQESRSIDLSHLPMGTYFLKVEQEDSFEVRKIVKMNQ